MFAIRETAVIDGQMFEKLDIGCQADADMGSLDQVVAQDGLIGKRSFRIAWNACTS